MGSINIKNLSFGYTTEDGIFENINLSIDTKWKLGLTGRNGQGKTTLFKLFNNNLEYSGDIRTSIKFIKFPLTIDNSNITVIELIEKYIEYENGWKVQVELVKLGIDEYLLERVFSTLSGGEQTKLMLAILFSIDNYFLLIDEPTNHLDAYGRETVINYLKSKDGYIIISHDLQFLDATIDHVLAIERACLKIYQSSMSVYLSEKARIDNQNRQQNLKLRKEIKRLDAAKRQTAKWSDKKEASKIGDTSRETKPDRGYIGHKAAKMMKRSKVLEQRLDKDIERKQNLLNNLDIDRKVNCQPLIVNKPLITLNHFNLHQSGKMLVEDLNLQIISGRVYKVNGRNGSGKTSLLSLLGNKEFKNQINYLSNIKISTIAQINEGANIQLEIYCQIRKLDLTKISTILINLGMKRIDFTTNLSEWSQGQLKKLAIATSISTSAHLYIWDEPFNYLDIIARTQIINLIENTEMTLIVVEHDMQIDRVVDEIIDL